MELTLAMRHPEDLYWFLFHSEGTESLGDGPGWVQGVTGGVGVEKRRVLKKLHTRHDYPLRVGMSPGACGLPAHSESPPRVPDRCAETKGLRLRSRPLPPYPHPKSLHP